jgi:hypothetical protein
VRTLAPLLSAEVTCVGGEGTGGGWGGQAARAHTHTHTNTPLEAVAAVDVVDDVGEYVEGVLAVR